MADPDETGGVMMETAVDVSRSVEALAREKLTGRRIDSVAVVDRLFDLAREVEIISCGVDATGNELVFHVPKFGLETKVIIDGARAKLRMMCARLGVICRERSGQDISLYGGSSEFVMAPDDRWFVEFMNTPDQHHFSIRWIS